MKKYKYELLVLLSSTIVMVLELTATRVLSPYVGTSNIVWTSIIGIILASMAIGYYLGGVLADKKYNLLGYILIISGIFISLIPLLEVTIIDFLSENIENLKIVSVLSSIILFMIPNILLATIYPYCMKLKNIKEENIGVQSGKLSFFETIGSILGTFLTGFLLLPLLGNRIILLSLAIILVLISLFFIKKKIKSIILFIIFIVFIVLIYILSNKIFNDKYPNIILDKDTIYNRVFVADLYIERNNASYKHGRELRMNNRRQSIDVKDLENVNYYNYFNLMPNLKENFSNVLLIGGGAYSYPKLFAKTFKDKHLDVVEIDPELVNIAKKYFNYKDYQNINNYSIDGRSYLNKNKKKYDFILVDAYKGVLAPFELTTLEAINEMKRSLTSDGIVIANVMGATKGKKSLYLQAQYKTFKESFDKVLLLTYFPDSEEVNTNILIGFKNYKENKVNYNNELFSTLVDYEIKDDVVTLTDDYAPVEYYTANY